MNYGKVNFPIKCYLLKGANKKRYKALDMVAIAISIIEIAWTPYNVVLTVRPGAVMLAAANGLAAVIGLVSSFA